MKKLLLISAGAIFYLICSIVLTGYGNKYTHPGLNSAIVNTFNSRYNKYHEPGEKFHNYEFEFFEAEALQGTAVTESGFEYINEDLEKKSVLGWISHGGYSADEPQLPASYRHFYDPTQPAGQRYLKDLLDSWWVSLMITNPKVDHVEWGISHPEHTYNYENAKLHMKLALETDKPALREESMAFAWRALGETLHLIADMGIPCHVRDDAHPNPHIIVDLGDPDPYEEICAVIAKESGVMGWMTGTTDPEVIGFCRGKKASAKSIAENLAAWTNRNFFTNQTISGENLSPRIHPEKDYASPKLEDCTYDENNRWYTKNVGGNNVLMCKNVDWWSYYKYDDFNPYIDKECVESQVRALAPQIVEAGVEVIRCFIPKLEVNITLITGDSIKGEVIHTPDVEYEKEIKYSGLVEIRRESDDEVIQEVMCKEGKFADEFDPDDFDTIEDKAYAEIECGGIVVFSEPYEDPLYNFMVIQLENIDDDQHIFTLTESLVKFNAIGWFTPFEKPLKWVGNNFVLVHNWSYDDTYYEEGFVGILSPDRSTIESLGFRRESESEDSSVDWILKLHDVPTRVYKDSLYSAIPDGQAQQYVEEFSVEMIGPNTHSVLDHVFWSNMRIEIRMYNIDFEQTSNIATPRINYSK